MLLALDDDDECTIDTVDSGERDGDAMGSITPHLQVKVFQLKSFRCRGGLAIIFGGIWSCGWFTALV